MDIEQATRVVIDIDLTFHNVTMFINLLAKEISTVSQSHKQF